MAADYALSPSPISQSHYETITRTADFTAVPNTGDPVSSPVPHLTVTSTGADVTAGLLTVGSPSGAVVPFTLTGLTPGLAYTLNIVVTKSGNIIAGEATVLCPD
jgi:hypothetical protein